MPAISNADLRNQFTTNVLKSELHLPMTARPFGEATRTPQTPSPPNIQRHLGVTPQKAIPQITETQSSAYPRLSPPWEQRQGAKIQQMGCALQITANQKNELWDSDPYKHAGAIEAATD